MRGWRGLGLFWAGLLLFVGATAGTLQLLGPPPGRPTAARAPAAAHAPASHEGPRDATNDATHDPAPATRTAEPAHPPESRRDPTRIAPPDPALLEKSALLPETQLPRVAPDGRVARIVYAAPAPPPPAGLPRIALLLSGIGQSEKDSRAAIDALPGAVSLAVSAYAGSPPSLYDAARAGGHEMLASLPMEPQGFPLNDAGTRSLLTGLSAQDNQLNLHWALGRVPGEVGATSASDGMRGERFSDITGALDPVLDEIARRGLLYIDARPGRTPQRPGLFARGVDVVLDDPPARAEIEGKLATLERIARDKGTAIGLAGSPRPVTVERLAAWAQGLQARGLVLVPVSTLVAAP